MAVPHSCASCGLFGWKVRRRARWAAEIADAALIAFFAGLAADKRAMPARPESPWLIYTEGGA